MRTAGFHQHQLTTAVRLFEAGCFRGTFFFTLEYCEGGSVADLLKKRGAPLPVEKATKIALQALDGLAYAHQVVLPAVKLAGGETTTGRGLVHRDLKPHNLFLARGSEKFVTKIGDYGLAKAFDLSGLSGLTATGATAGTPRFMPRQQLLEYKYAKPDVDVWALAASLYYMLTLQPPRDFRSGRDPWQVVLQTNAVPIRQRLPDIPARLAAVIDEALIDDPEIRFKAASEFRAALKEAL
jgi:serine/threonine protein kinase